MKITNDCISGNVEKCQSSSQCNHYYCAMLYTQSAVMPQYVVCLFVCPSVTFRCCDLIAWNTSQIISWLTISARADPLADLNIGNLQSAPTATPPKSGWNRGGAMCNTCNISEMVQQWIDSTSHTYFRFVPKSMSLDDLKRRTRTFAKKSFYGASQKK